MIRLASPADTESLGVRLAARARTGDVFALFGDLGAGKTTFARAFVNAVARRHGCPSEDVPSPTFTLVQEYAFGSERVCHFDLYRIERPEDALELGIEDAFAEAICLIEWPDRLDNLLPDDRFDLRFAFADDGSSRTCAISGVGACAPRTGEMLGDAGP